MNENDEKTESYIETIAPTPHWGDEGITMEALIRARLVEAQRLYEHFHHRSDEAFNFLASDKSPEAVHARDRMMVSLMGHLYSATEADLLMAVQRLDPSTADQFAADHLSRGESGDYYPEMIWDWMVERGIDPEKVRAEAKEEIAAEGVSS